MMLEKADSNKDGRVEFQDFYSVMVRDNTYWFIHITSSIYRI
jgi:Ca2+-binding EF-hand superfamily protein